MSPSLSVILISPFIGSFIANLAIRLPEGRRILRGRSSCMSCSAALRAVDLVPVVSWVKLGRKCSHCAAPISGFYPAVELSTLIIAVWSVQCLGGWLAAAGFGLGCALLTLAIIDARYYWLPDIITLPLIPAGLITAYLLQPDPLTDHLIGAAAGFAIFFAISKLYRMAAGKDGLGFGDAKLLAALGAWVAWPGLPYIIAIASCGGLGFAVCRAYAAGRKLSTGERIPFGPFLALAGWLVWLYNPASLVAGLT